jgi:tRNA 2-thiouridine synthesizing protein A
VTALDAGAPADIPAWCGMTGHALVAHDPLTHAFWVRAKP